jgi:hypothetical protein
MATSPVVLLIDNGSLRPDATMALRRLAELLSARSGLSIEPVSLLHSSQVSAADLGGVPAQIVKPGLRRLIEAGAREFIFLPLFLGPSRGITDYLPELIDDARAFAPELRAVVADTLAGADVDGPDVRLAEMLAAHVRQTMQAGEFSHPQVALVDHGTPVEPVNRVRNAVARQLADLLGTEVSTVVASSMERRAGAEYDFNEPLLENVDQIEALIGGDLIVALFFLLPGRHAGAAGDVAQICDALLERKVFSRVEMTPLLGEHPVLLDILADRLQVALARIEGGAAGGA